MVYSLIQKSGVSHLDQVGSRREIEKEREREREYEWFDLI